MSSDSKQAPTWARVWRLAGYGVSAALLLAFAANEGAFAGDAKNAIDQLFSKPKTPTPPTPPQPPAPAPGDDLIAQTTQGKVQGFRTKGIVEFLGIPYAAPPVSTNPSAPPCTPGNLRWCPPVKHAPWTGVLKTTAHGPVCAQITLNGVYAGPPNNNEDCLFLNVYTPGLPSKGDDNGKKSTKDVIADLLKQGTGNDKGQGNKKLPVLIFFHGAGATASSSNDHDGSKLALQGQMVVVTLNMRIGLLGFLGHPALNKEGHLFSNYQVMDAQFVMRWVRDNIEAFGGDPNNVTLSGQSGGSQISVTQLLSPLAKGLFKRVILLSGPINANATPLSAAEERGVNFAVAAGCGSGTGPDVARCLRALPASKIMELSTNGVYITYNGVTQATGSGPYTTFITTDGILLPIDPVVAFKTGLFNKVPIITTVTQDEGAFGLAANQFYKPDRSPLTEAAFVTSITNRFNGNAGPWATPPAYPAGTTEKVLAKYPLSDYASPQLQWSKLNTDSNHPCQQSYFLRIVAPQTPVYAGEFRDRTMPFYFPPLQGFVPGAYHTGDLAYYFPLYHGGPQGIPHPLNAEQERLSAKLIAMWASYVRTDNPNIPGSTVVWPRYAGPHNSSQLLALNVDSAGGLSKLPATKLRAEHNCDFWDGILTWQSTLPR